MYLAQPSLQCDYSNRATLKKVNQSLGFLKTKNPDVVG